MSVSFSDIEQWIQDNRGEVLEFFRGMLAIPAISPLSGGQGEKQKADFIEQYLHSMNFGSVERLDALDPSAEGGIRPNLLFYTGKLGDGPRLWFICHMDVVPPGDLSAWTTEPFQPLIADGKIYARGAEDNGQSLVGVLFALKCIFDLGSGPVCPVGLAIVADEETGNTFGIQYLIEQQIFHSDDFLIVPDAGFPQGDFIEIAEKTICWLRIEITGKQAHGSMPHLGLNAHRIGMQFALALDQALHDKFPLENPLFKPPASTFEPTKKEKNQDNINAIPGKDILYFDCRLLPDYGQDAFLEVIETLRVQFEHDSGAKIAIEYPNQTSPTPITPTDSPVVLLLTRAIQAVRGIDVALGGVGGGTCAAYFRGLGIPAVVYERTDEQAHKPNEYCVIDWLFEGLSIFATMMLLE